MNKIRSFHKFVSRHKTAIAVVGTAVTATYLHIKVIDDVNQRLEEMGIDPMQFHNPEED